MKRRLIILFTTLIILILLFPQYSYAHPGRTAADGCHYCRTNCDRWGVPWNERHCHGGKKAPVVVPKYSPTPKPRKPSIYTPKPLPTAFPQSKVLGTENKNER